MMNTSNITKSRAAAGTAAPVVGKSSSVGPRRPSSSDYATSTSSVVRAGRSGSATEQRLTPSPTTRKATSSPIMSGVKTRQQTTGTLTSAPAATPEAKRKEPSLPPIPEELTSSAIRSTLEEYLYDVNHKVASAQRRFILDRFTELERLLMSTRLENASLKGRLQERSRLEEVCASLQSANKTVARPSYARVTAATPTPTSRPTPLPKPRPQSDSPLYVKARGKDSSKIQSSIKEALRKEAPSAKIRFTTKVKSGDILIVCASQKDHDLVKASLDKHNIEFQTPRKILPRIMLHDVSKDTKVDDLIDEIIEKNLPDQFDPSAVKLATKVIFKFPSETSTQKIVVSAPACLTSAITRQGRAYVGLRSYRAYEHARISRCKMCQSFKHSALRCSAEVPLCSHCACKGHSVSECAKEENPACCINCKQKGNKNTDHPASDKACPEYRKALEDFISKIDTSSTKFKATA